MTIFSFNPKVKLKKAAFILLVLLTAGVANATTYTVSNTLDAGAGSLRQAITDANANVGLDTIRFLILPTGNTFESSGSNSWAVIQINTVLPTISDAVLIDGTTQTNTNLGTMVGRVVGADNITQASIAYPDVYIVPSATFAFPTTSTGVAGNGITVNATGVTIRGLCISGFGNTNSASSTASHHADIVVVRSASTRNIGFTMNDCFVSCDPRGAFPALISGSNRRRTKGGSVVVGGNNNGGVIRNNYMAYAGTYHIHFNGNFDHLSVGPTSVTLITRSWTVSENILITNGTNSAVTSGKAADAINTMRCKQFRILNNYIEDSEQVGIDLGYNADSNYVANNTITGMVNATAAPPLAGMRIGLGSQRDTFFRNAIYNNSGTAFRGAIWIDRSSVNTGGTIVQDNSYNLISQNVIYNNNSSGIVLSDNGGTVAAQFNTITRNRIYDNAYLGIDLGFPSSSSPLTSTNVTVNDNGDVDAGVNDLQNFPLIDSARITASNVHVWGSAPAGATVEFFVRDNGTNNHYGRTFNYGEGRLFIGSAVEGSAADLATGTTSYNTDGNVASNNANRFYFVLPYASFFNTDSITSTATVNGNTSEFGPKSFVQTVLDCHLLEFSGTKPGDKSSLKWNAIYDKNFSHFQVEYSTDGRDFATIGNVFPNADESALFSYQHTTNSEKVFYRLKLVSKNQTSRYSQVLAIGTRKANVFLVKAGENPFHNRLPIVIESETTADVKVNLFQSNGALVTSKPVRVVKGSNNVVFEDLFNVPPGYYQIVVEGEGRKVNIPVIKQ